MSEVPRLSAEGIAPYKDDILATKPLINVLNSSRGQQQANVIAHMYILTTHGGMSEEEYLELLTSCQDTGNFGPMLEEYAKINNRVLENVLQDNTITDEEVRNAARNTLGVIQGSLRGYGKQGANSVDHIGTPPSFQKPDWLFSAERWLESHPNKTMEDMYLALEGVSSSGSNDQTLRVQGRDDIHEGVRKLLE